MAEKRLEAIVSGQVQGVYFRAFTVRHAQKLGLKGFVRNTPEGSIEIVAEGDEEKLKELLSVLKGGPPLSRVEKVKTGWKEARKEFGEFSVRY